MRIACLLTALLWGTFAFGQNNVVLIIADDLGVDYMNVYGEGTDPAPTPVIDALAADGVVFTNAWTNPICSPSRANMLAGKYGFRTGIGTAITGLQSATLDTAEFTLPKAVKYQTGAATAMVGKWHLGHSSQAFKRNPNACGFDLYSGNVEGQLSNYSLWQKTVNGNNSLSFNYATSEAVDDAISWVDSRSGNWFLVLSFNAPHVPFHKPPNHLHSFDDLPGGQSAIDANPIPYFKAMVESMDTEIGRFLSHLDVEGELGNTNVIFIGDNGTDGAVVQSPFDPDRSKATIYQGGVRVPLIISGPAVSDPGRTADELVNSTDLYHTILEMMGGDPTSLSGDVATDSRSFMPVLLNSSDSGSQRAWIYGDLFKPTTTVKDGKVITDGEYKLLEFDNGNSEFYHLAIDPLELNPLTTSELNAQAQAHYDFLCTELSLLVDSDFCEVFTAVNAPTLYETVIYPNPVSDHLNFHLPSNIFGDGRAWKGRIYDSAGSLVQSFRAYGAGTHRIPVVDLASGAYRVVFYRGEKAVATATFLH